jgi:DNA mismatch repair ATPase MutL
MKKIVSIALLSLIPLTLASCGSGNQKQDSQSSSATSKTEKVSKKVSSKSSSKKEEAKSSSSSEKKSTSQTSSSRQAASSSTNSKASSSSSASTTSSKPASKNLSREELTAAEKKNNNHPLADETIKNSEAAINLVKEKYGDKGWKVAFNSIGKSSPIYFHITSDHDGSYYVYANGDVQNAGGDLSDHASDIENN